MGYRIKSRFIYKQVGQRLKQLRNQKGVSQKVVADYLGVDRSTYTNYEMGKLTILSDIEQKKLHFILTGEENRDSSLNYGFNFSDLVYLKSVTGIDYPYWFAGM